MWQGELTRIPCVHAVSLLMSLLNVSQPQTAVRLNLGLQAHLVWLRTTDLQRILSHDVDGTNATNGKRMRSFVVPSDLTNPRSTSTKKDRIVIMAAWQGPRVSVALVDFNRLATMHIVPLPYEVEKADLVPGNHVSAFSPGVTLDFLMGFRPWLDLRCAMVARLWLESYGSPRGGVGRHPALERHSARTGPSLLSSQYPEESTVRKQQVLQWAG